MANYHSLWAGLVSGCLLLGQGLTAPALLGPKPAENTKIQTLELRLQKLEEQVASLRSRVARLESKPSAPIVTIQPSIGRGPEAMPPASKPFQFNGLTYYFIPLAEDSLRTPLSIPRRAK
ncbi:MAG: hypothetical protein M1608_06880 [Candidatus Omnitrophica bacterium]|nr:hypothetical protein [Candidatus Omnitrophota bacterium]